MNTRKLRPALVIAATLAIGIFIGSVLSRGARAARLGREDAKLLSSPSPAELSDSFSRIAGEVEPAVVNIKSETDVRLHHHMPGGLGDEPPDDAPSDGFFDHFFHFGGPPSNVPETSLGSGVILDPSGYILTNCHVIMRDGGDQPADRVRVFLKDQDETSKGYPARVVGYDQWTDLAVIKIDHPTPLPAATLGDSAGMRVGDWVLAIGSPFGLNSTVTAGIISAKGRGIEPGRDGEFKHFIQTDAAINPGNSGGPLVNLRGQVIGINTAIATDRDSNAGVGFAIPAETARRIYNDLVSKGKVRRGAIGVSFTAGRNRSVLDALGADHGVVVESVTPDSPADHAGIRLGDVIRAVNSKSTATGDDLLNIVSDTAPGTKVKVDYLRDGKPQSTELVVADWNKIVGAGSPPAPKPGVARPVDAPASLLGLSVRNLTSDQAKTIARDVRLSSPEGVVVTEVKPGSFAEDLGLQRFDVILSIDRQSILTVDDFNRVEAALKPGKPVLFLVAEESDSGFTTRFLADRLP
jgi:serine protease Do